MMLYFHLSSQGRPPGDTGQGDLRRVPEQTRGGTGRTRVGGHCPGSPWTLGRPAELQGKTDSEEAKEE